MGEIYDVIPVSELPSDRTAYYDRRDGAVLTLFLLPSLYTDAQARVFCSSDKELFLPSAAMAAAIFLVGVRGLPLDECEVEIGDNIYTVRTSGNVEKYELILTRCKSEFMKSAFLRQNTEVDCRVFSDENVEIIFLLSEDDECVPAEVLRSLLLPESGELRIACAISASSAERVSLRFLSTKGNAGAVLKVAVCAACYVKRIFVNSQRFQIFVSDCRLRDAERIGLQIRVFGSGFSVGMLNAPEPLTFFAP